MRKTQNTESLAFLSLTLLEEEEFPNLVFVGEVIETEKGADVRGCISITTPTGEEISEEQAYKLCTVVNTIKRFLESTFGIKVEDYETKIGLLGGENGSER